MMRRTTSRIALAIAVSVATAVVGVLAARSGGSGPERAAEAPSTSSALIPTPGAIAAADPAPAKERETSLDIAGRVAEKFDLTITSGYRDPAHNAAVGGVEGSYHTRGTRKDPGAVDLVGTTADMRRALAWVQRNVDDLAEGMIHAVCVVDDEHPWQVSDSGLHLHIAFDAKRARSGVPEYISIAAGSGCRSAVDRFRTALLTIGRKRGEHDLTRTQAMRATLTASSMALDGDYGRLGPRGRTLAIDARRHAQDVLDRALAAKRRGAHKRPDAEERYRTTMATIDARQRKGELTAEQADAQRLATIDRALSGAYGTLTTVQREAIEHDRAALIAATQEPQPTTTTAPTTTTPPTTTPMPTPTTTTESAPAPTTQTPAPTTATPSP